MGLVMGDRRLESVDRRYLMILILDLFAVTSWVNFRTHTDANTQTHTNKQYTFNYQNAMSTELALAFYLNL